MRGICEPPRRSRFVPGGAERHAFNFNGGLVRFDAKLSEESGSYKGGLGWQILGKPKGLDGKRPKIANFWRKKSGSIFVLPAGDWDLFGELADHRHVRLNSKISVAPGSEELAYLQLQGRHRSL